MSNENFVKSYEDGKLIVTHPSGTKQELSTNQLHAMKNANLEMLDYIGQSNAVLDTDIIEADKTKVK